MKRILTIQDISCLGKCSLTVALPIISACGIETCVLPTAVLSTHTAFNGFTFHDLTSEMPKIARHWKEQNVNFDSIYTGYLGSFEQIDIVSNIIDDFKTNKNFILIDPVMADNGKLYHGFDQSFADKMCELCSKADIIVPNITEACFMLHEEYVPSGYSKEYIESLLVKLTKTGAKTAILTGVSFNNEQLGVYAYDNTTKKFVSYFNKKIPVSFHGTGDVFASTLCGALTKGLSVYDAIKTAVDFTVESIEKTIDNKNNNWYGVDFESALPLLINRLNK